MRSHHATCIGTLALVAAIGCGIGPTEPTPPAGMKAGVLGFRGGPLEVVTIPAEVAVGSTATLMVQTWGGGCLVKGTTPVVVTRRRVVVRPYDRAVDPSWVCLAVLTHVEHTVEIHFDTAGEWDIEIRGSQSPDHVPHVVHRTVLVK